MSEMDCAGPGGGRHRIQLAEILRNLCQQISHMSTARLEGCAPAKKEHLFNGFKETWDIGTYALTLAGCEFLRACALF